jgi:hypothetical protein
MLSVTVTLFSGRRREGIMLSANQESMRIALRGAGDTTELRRVEGRWLADDNRPVDLEVLLTDGHGERDLPQQARPRVMAAGRG